MFDRNKYSVWAAYKHREHESVTGYDIGDYEIAYESENVLDDIINTEEVLLLRRELAFIKRDFRDILIAYYLEYRSVRDISLSLSISEDAAKQRLHRARKKLKEGMNMTREFGKRSYNPDKMHFLASGSQPSGLPWKVVHRKIPQNILLQASNNPSTIEELSLELGIALPYMEEEVDILYRATLLEKQGDKYITNFFIFDRESRLEMYNAMIDGSKERSVAIQKLIDESMADIRNLNIAREHIDDNTIRWFLVPHTIDYFIETIVKEQSGGFYDPPVRANGETWGFVGYETTTELPDNITMGHNGCENDKNAFWTYKYGDYSMWDQCGEPEYREAMLLCDCLRSNRFAASFSEVEKSLWDNIDGKYAHADGSGAIVPDVLVMTSDKIKKINQLLEQHTSYGLIAENYRNLYKKLEYILKKHSHAVLKNYIGYNIRMEMYFTRMMAVHDLVDSKFLKVPEDTSKSSLGMYILLK